MKKIFVSMVAVMSTIASMAQVITFERTEHDFGKINEADGRVTTVFEFKNEGMDPLVLSNVRASCGCTTPKWTREPIEPGQVGQITVTYNPNGRPGRFQKTITVTSNAKDNGTTKLYIKGEVIPKPAKPANVYKLKVGELSMKSKELNLGTVKKNDIAKGELEYANLNDKELSVELATSDADNFMTFNTSLGILKKDETGKFQFALDSKACKLYGPVEVFAYVVVGEQKQLTDEYKLTIKANIVEDFSALSVADRQAAPIAEVKSTIDMGKLAAGKKYKKSFAIKNAGQNPLMLRRLYCNNKNVELTAGKTTIKSGKQGEMKVQVNTVDEQGKALEAGTYSREVIIITNDPQNPIQKVTLTWTVE